MEPKYSHGQSVMILKSVYFHEEELVVRSGEIGMVMEIEFVTVDDDGSVVYDYIVRIGDKILFFFEEELASYPNRE